MQRKIREGDKVVVTAGNDKGKVGVVLAFVGDRVKVEGVNMRKKHIKPREGQKEGGRIELEMPIHISNLKVWADDQAVKLRSRVGTKGERELYYLNQEDKPVVYRAVKRPRA